MADKMDKIHDDLLINTIITKQLSQRIDCIEKDVDKHNSIYNFGSVLIKFLGVIVLVGSVVASVMGVI
jgi:hypothetical protein